MNKVILTTRDLAIGYATKGHADSVVADSLSLEVHSGELVCVLGPNGVGKSTLLHTLAGMLRPLRGGVYLGPDPLHTIPTRALAKRVSVVLTHRADVGRLSVGDMVALGRHPHTGWAGTLSEHDRAVVRWAIDATGAASLARRYVAELSDGERQKAMIARALAQEPELMLLDEPTAFLDLARRASVMRLLRDLARDTGRAFLVTTHDIDLALRCADRIWLFPADGPIRTGLPESLALSGAFESVFSSEGLHFDPYTGTFRLASVPRQTMRLIGGGLHAYWTRRALEREGFDVVEAGAPHAPAVEVRTLDGCPRWRTVTDGCTGSWDSLEELISGMRGAGAGAGRPSPNGEFR